MRTPTKFPLEINSENWVSQIPAARVSKYGLDGWIGIMDTPDAIKVFHGEFRDTPDFAVETRDTLSPTTDRVRGPFPFVVSLSNHERATRTRVAIVTPNDGEIRRKSGTPIISLFRATNIQSVL